MVLRTAYCVIRIPPITRSTYATSSTLYKRLSVSAWVTQWKKQVPHVDQGHNQPATQVPSNPLWRSRTASKQEHTSCCASVSWCRRFCTERRKSGHETHKNPHTRTEDMRERCHGENCIPSVVDVRGDARMKPKPGLHQTLRIFDKYSAGRCPRRYNQW